MTHMDHTDAQPLWATASRRIHRSSNCEVWSLSPDDEAYTSFIKSLAPPPSTRPGRRTDSLTPNQLSVALLVRFRASGSHPGPVGQEEAEERWSAYHTGIRSARDDPVAAGDGRGQFVAGEAVRIRLSPEGFRSVNKRTAADLVNARRLLEEWLPIAELDRLQFLVGSGRVGFIARNNHPDHTVAKGTAETMLFRGPHAADDPPRTR